MSEELLTIRVVASRQAIAALDVAQVLYLLAELRQPEGVKIARRPINLCLVIDRSTSMQGDRLDRVKSAAALVIERLVAEDIISIVAFSDRAEVVVPASPAESRSALVTRIRRVMASGGTEIYQGLSAGIKEMHSVPLEDSTNHLILLTDGHTYGDVEACLQLAHSSAVEGIGFSAFGIGTDWNDHFLDQLVAPSGGQSAYIESPSQVVDFLQARIKGLGAVYAQDVRMASQFPVSVALLSAFKLAPYAQPLPLEDGEIRLGAVEGQQPLAFLLEFKIDPQLPGRRIRLPLTVRLDIPSQYLRDHVVTHSFDLEVVTEEPGLSPPRELVDAVKALSFYRLNERVWDDISAGDLEGATKRLRRLTTRLLEAGHSKLAQQALAEAERLASAGSLSTGGRKKLRFGTRSLLSQSIAIKDWR